MVLIHVVPEVYPFLPIVHYFKTMVLIHVVPEVYPFLPIVHYFKTMVLIHAVLEVSSFLPIVSTGAGSRVLGGTLLRTLSFRQEFIETEGIVLLALELYRPVPPRTTICAGKLLVRNKPTETTEMSISIEISPV